GDFNGDGNQDLIVSLNAAGLTEFATFLGNGDGTFTFSGDNGGWDGIGSFVAADFDRDGKLDVAMPVDFLGLDFIDIWLGEGNGDFVFKPYGLGVNGVRTTATDDFNRDGIVDIADSNTGSCGYGCSTIYLGNGDGTFTPATSQPSTSGLLTGDFDGD